LALTSIHLHDSPVWLTLFCYALSCLVILFTDRFALPKRERRRHRPPTGMKQYVIEAVARLPVIFLVFAGFFAISWRPLYAAAGTMSFFVIFTGISRAKFKFIREPLVFSDIALVADVFKYKSIFYANSLNVVFWTVAFLYVFGVSGLYMYFEPDVIPDRHWYIWALIMLAIADVPWLLLFYGPVNRWTADMVRKLVDKPSAKISTIRFGTFTSVVFHFIMWLGARREKIVLELQGRFIAAVHDLIGHDADNKAPLIIVWQSESFLDMRRLGVDTLTLPTMDRLQKRASQWGLLATVFEGGYTLRTEFAVLSGLLPDDLHVDASYPYLRASHYTDVVWPTKLKNAGWSTHFIHPYDRTFFLRHKAMPQLGFEKMTMLDEFEHDVLRDGPYVSDATLTQKVIQEVEAQTDAKGSFIFVASMANHGPWEPGRCGDLTDPVSIYLEILEQSDAALGTLVDHLDKLDRPVWLVFYGDHAPLLKSFADPFPDPRTDYYIVPLGSVRKPKGSSVAAQTEEPWNLFKAMLKHANLQKDELQ
jgi:phosphoglycerol transferase MdoB-like AlkP superfamily enzyme